MYSYHPAIHLIGKASCFARGWLVNAKPRSLTTVLLSHATSPSLYANGYRARASFMRADWVGLDFDDGPTLREIEHTFQGQIHVIGTTKSHQKQKGSALPCDRFRVWLKLETTITNARDYEATARHYVYHYDADKACVDAARLFWPCQTITSVCWEGETADVVCAPEKTYAKAAGTYTGIPKWVKEWLNGNAPNRNKTVFKCAVWLARNGWGEDRIVDTVMGSALMYVGHTEPLTDRELRKTVRSGIERAAQPDRN